MAPPNCKSSLLTLNITSATADVMPGELSLSQKKEKSFLMVLKRKTISIFYSSQVAIIFQETLRSGILCCQAISSPFTVLLCSPSPFRCPDFSLAVFYMLLFSTSSSEEAVRSRPTRDSFFWPNPITLYC